MFTGIRAITFDADQTLWDLVAVVRSGMQVAIDAIAVRQRTTSLTVDDLLARHDRLADELWPQGVGFSEIRRRLFEEALETPDPGFAAEIDRRFTQHRFAQIPIYPDVLPTLAAFDGVTKGIVTNGDSDPERCGLAGVFDFVVFADEHQRWKPDPAIFDIAATMAGCAPHEMVHVGDSYSSDVNGALAAGVHPVWLNRDRWPSVEGVIDIHSLNELPALIRCGT